MERERGAGEKESEKREEEKREERTNEKHKKSRTVVLRFLFPLLKKKEIRGEEESSSLSRARWASSRCHGAIAQGAREEEREVKRKHIIDSMPTDGGADDIARSLFPCSDLPSHLLGRIDPVVIYPHMGRKRGARQDSKPNAKKKRKNSPPKIPHRSTPTPPPSLNLPLQPPFLLSPRNQPTDQQRSNSTRSSRPTATAASRAPSKSSTSGSAPRRRSMSATSPSSPRRSSCWKFSAKPGTC